MITAAILALVFVLKITGLKNCPNCRAETLPPLQLTMQRMNAYCHPDGKQATRDQLLAALAPWADQLARQSTRLYSSLDMKSLVDTQALQNNADVLLPLVTIDPRCGKFAQSDVSAVLGQLLKQKEAVVMENAADPSKPFQHNIDMMSYMLRVMLAHIMIKFDGQRHCDDSDAGSLVPIFKCIKLAKPVDVGGRLMRKRQRIGNRPNPFPFIQEIDRQR